MAVRFPLVLGGDGIAQQLQSGDTIADSPVISVAPTTPASGAYTLGTIILGGAELPAYQPAHGNVRALQQHVGRGAWGSASYAFNTNTVGYSGNLFSAALSVLGTATTVVFASTNYGTMQPRLSYVSAATTGSTCGYYGLIYSLYFTIGSGTGLGGGQFIQRFMFGDTVAAPLAFVGLTSSVLAPSATTDPSALTNCIGIGVSQTVANPTHLYLFYGGSSAQPPIDLGANFPANTSNTDFYELTVFSDPITGQTGVTVNRYTSSVIPAFTFSQILTNTTPGTTLPASGTPLGPRAYRSNNATAAAVTIAFSQTFLAGQS